jgi:hypothetical protein
MTMTAAEAAILEDLVPVDANPEILGLIARYRAFRDARDNAVAQLDEVKAKLMAEITALGAQAVTVGGKVNARMSTVETVRLDQKELKAKHPELAAEFTRVTVSARLTVS